MKAGKAVAFVLWLKFIHYTLYSLCCLEQVFKYFEQVENENKVITASSWQWLSVPCVWKICIT